MRRDLLRRSSSLLDHIITWTLTCTNTCAMQSSTSKVHEESSKCNDHALTLYTVNGDLLTYRKSKRPRARWAESETKEPGELKSKKIDPKQIPRIQAKQHVITSPIVPEIRKSYTAGECSTKQVMVQMIVVRIATARQLMYKRPEGRSSRERGPHRSLYMCIHTCAHVFTRICLF